MRSSRIPRLGAALGLVALLGVAPAHAAGVLRPIGTQYQAIEIVDHAVEVVINNGFARTKVTQIFHNPNSEALDAVYEFPVPPDAALSEMNIEFGDNVLHGEVVGSDEAQEIYDEQAAAGNQAGLGTQETYQRFEFSIAGIPADGDATMSFVYYEPVPIDTGVGRFLYPLENGGTDESAEFWTGQESDSVGHFSFDLTLKSAAPISEIRVPDVDDVDISDLGNGVHTIHFEASQGDLSEDVVAYYRLRDDLPGKVEVVPYRGESGGLGTFMLLVTPGIDLPAIEHGTDFTYVLDFSGSMQTKIDTLRAAVAQALSELGPEDRFRLIGFSDTAFEIAPLQEASPENVEAAVATLSSQGLLGGTNLYEGLRVGLDNSDPERVTSIFLVTDGVANTGIVDAVRFDALLRESDFRVFGFLMGNSANWPLMEIVTEASGGFYAPISNQDDTLGQVLLAKSKLTHESLHSAKLALSGIEISDTTDFNFGKVYRGQQLAVFGRYAEGGNAELTLSAMLRNRGLDYSLEFTFPELDEDSPELERLWALQMIHGIQKQGLLGLISAEEAAARVRELGIAYQLVTEQTSMLVLDDEGFEQAGIERNNLARTDLEHEAQGSSSGQPPTNNSVGSLGSDSSADLSSSSYGGALDPMTLALFGFALLGVARRRDERSRR
jgi:Ca-activated chloride channel homolog